MKKKAFLIILVAAICLLAIFSSKGEKFSLFSGYRYENHNRYNAGGASIDDTVNKLDISWIEGRVEIRYHDGDEIILEESTSKKLSRKTELHWLKDGNTLYVKYAASGFRSVSNLNKQLTVLLPENMELDGAEISTVSADVSANGLEGEDIILETVSGDLVLENIHADLLEINAVSGKVMLDKAEVDEVTADTTSGDLHLNFEYTPDSITTNAVSGNVTICLPRDAGFRAELDSLSGNVNCTLPAEKDGKEYVIGNEECLISADSVSGDLTLKENE